MNINHYVSSELCKARIYIYILNAGLISLSVSLIRNSSVSLRYCFTNVGYVFDFVNKIDLVLISF